jgi:hypothetical protein
MAIKHERGRYPTMLRLFTFIVVDILFYPSHSLLSVLLLPVTLYYFVALFTKKTVVKIFYSTYVTRVFPMDGPHFRSLNSAPKPNRVRHIMWNERMSK